MSLKKRGDKGGGSFQQKVGRFRGLLEKKRGEKLHSFWKSVFIQEKSVGKIPTKGAKTGGGM